TFQFIGDVGLHKRRARSSQALEGLYRDAFDFRVEIAQEVVGDADSHAVQVDGTERRRVAGDRRVKQREVFHQPRHWSDLVEVTAAQRHDSIVRIPAIRGPEAG